MGIDAEGLINSDITMQCASQGIYLTLNSGGSAVWIN